MLGKRYYKIGTPVQSRFQKFPHYDKNYEDFFNGYAKENYKWYKTKCLCGNDCDEKLSTTDRWGIEYHLVICKLCGLIRGEKYIIEEDLNHFYKNHYRNITSSSGTHLQPSIIFSKQVQKSIDAVKFIKKHSKSNFDNGIIMDIGGGAGGFLKSFENAKERILLDYYEPYLDYARIVGITTVKGGLDEAFDMQRPDLVILSHVIEHWNDFDYEIKKLISIQKKNQTLNYIEFPGIDSLKDGRRSYDFLGDIQIAHKWYFASYVFENIMNRYGFKKIHINSYIRGLFIYTGENKNLLNFYENVKKDLLYAEKMRKLSFYKKIIKSFLPSKFTMLLSKLKIKFLSNKLIN